MASQDRTVRDYIQPGEEELARLREDFDFNDTDKDGRITLGEFVRFLSALEAGMTAEECRIGFEELDTDDDGAISFDEFAAWWTER
jgi:Ca2+-binding EF-hand superfamily protein